MALTTSAIHAAERAYYLEREHDKRVEEYRELHERLPQGIEISAIRFAIHELRLGGHKYVADRLADYVERWKGRRAATDRCGV